MPFIPYAVVNEGAAAPSDAAYVSAVLADTPIGFWKMNEVSGLPQDSSGNGNHMTTDNGANIKGYRVTGPFPGSYGIFQANTANFTRANVTAVTDNWTLELFFLPTGVVDNTIFENGLRANSGYGIEVTGALKFQFLYGSIAFGDLSANNLTLSTWSHLVVLRRAGTAEYYFNGALDDSNAGTNTPVAPGTSTRIGSEAGISGVWSMCAIYTTALSSARIAAHYAASGL